MNRDRLTLKLFVIIGLCLFYACSSDTSKKEAVDGVEVSLVDPLGNQCSYALTYTQDSIVNRTLANIKAQVDANYYCFSGYLPGGKCGKFIPLSPGTCRAIYDDLRKYFRNNKTLTFCITTHFGKKWLAAADVNYSNTHLYLSEEFFEVEDDERMRTIIHELHHLQGNHLKHTATKNCEYYENWALVAEHCLTCQVSYAPPEFSSCSGGEDGLFIIKGEANRL